MLSIGWRSYFSVGIVNFDKHHHNAINLLDNIYEEFVNNASISDLIVMLNSLRKNIENHIKSEEVMMKNLKYPYSEKHIFAHNQFFRLFDKIYLNLEKGESNFSFREYATISYYILSHILYEDSEMSEYIIIHDN